VYHAELYDLVTPASFGGDTEWYRARARECQGTVLELGAGTGRSTIPIAEDGVTVYALEPDTGMVQMLRQKLQRRPREVQARVTVHVGDMRAFAFPQRFALIISPFRAFLHNLTEDDRLACLNAVRAHLQPGGCVAFNVFHPSLELMSRNAGPWTGTWRATGSYEKPDGATVVRSESNRYDTVNQRVDSLHRYEEYGADGVLTRTTLHRLALAYLYPADLRRLLKEAGFNRVTIAGGFDGRPFRHEMDELVVEAWVE
jgi:SAM-dependent methyltransferase